MAIDFKALAAKAAATRDMTQAQAGGGDYEPPAAGMARCRLVAYIETGRHREEYKGQPKVKEKVTLIFELSGPKHKPTEGVPIRLTITESLSLNEKANFFKLFQRMNYQGKSHFAEMLGDDFICTVVHKKSTDGKKTYANLRDEGGYTVRPPFLPNPETGEDVRIVADPQISPTKCFIWDYADAEQWASIFIDGSYDEKKLDDGTVIPAKSKNQFQNAIRSAINFEGSPAQEVILAAGGDALALPPVVTPARDEEDVQASADKKAGASSGADADPLAGL